MATHLTARLNLSAVSSVLDSCKRLLGWFCQKPNSTTQPFLNLMYDDYSDCSKISVLMAKVTVCACILQVQTKYLGRNWRRSNMKIISAIYRRVRHHLHDDWAYGNDLDAKPWDFQQQEFALKACIEHFNNTYYLQEGEKV